MAVATGPSTNPMFVIEDNSQWSEKILTANTARKITSGTAYLVFTASTNGDFLSRLSVQSLGTNPDSVLRIFENNGSDITVEANSCLLGELPLPATTASETAAWSSKVYNLNRRIKSGHRIYVTVGTAGSDGWQAIVIADRY